MSRKIILLGCYCGDQNYDLIQRLFRGTITVSNSEYEKSLFHGFLEAGEDIELISAPSVGKYPFTCKKNHISKFKKEKNINIISYYSFAPVCHHSKYRNLLKMFKKQLNYYKMYDDVVVIASEPHLPYLKILKYVKLKYKFKTSLIVPDIPENIISFKSKIYKIYKNKINREIQYISNNFVDSYMFFTEQISTKFRQCSKSIVREGIIDSFKIFNVKNDFLSCTYIGKTNEKNGIKLLIETASKIKNVHFDLYGTGDMDKLLKNIKLPNLTYHGFINPNDIEEKLLKSDILLSPRYYRDYTSYSFPSKVLKYLSYCKPVVTFKLPCYSEKFDKVLIYPESETVESFVKGIENAIRRKNDDLYKIYKENIGYLLVENVVDDYLKILF